MEILKSILYMLPGLLIGFSIHEFSHAYVAYKCGDETQLSSGRLTLNPIKHIDILGFIMILVVGFGWAKPVQINTRSLKNPRRDELLISLAGPISNFVLSFLLAIIVYIMQLIIGMNTDSTFLVVLHDIIQYASLLNLMLALFNLIPLPGFDGYHSITALLPYKITEKLYFLERFSVIIFIIFIFSGLPDIILGDVLTAIYSSFFALFNVIASIFK